MTRETKKTEKSEVDANAVEATKEDRKRPIRITRDMLQNKGPLQIPPGFEKPGFKNLWICVRDDSPYELSKWEKLGYTPATHEVTGEKCIVGKHSEKNILLEIPEELHAEIRAVKAELRQEVTDYRKGIQKPKQPGQVEGIYEKEFTIK